MQALLDVSSLCIQRGEKTICSDLGFTLQQGEIIVVLGPNGAGKSSLLLALAGLIAAQGEIAVLGKPLAAYSNSDLMQTLAWQGDLPPTEFGLTVEQRLALVLVGAEQSISAVAQEMEVAHLLMRPLQALSSGERQRVELAALMLRDVPIWLLDEPTTHLDLKHQIKTVKVLRKQAQAGRAMVVILHDMQQAMAMADALVLMDGEGGVQYGLAEDLWDKDRLSCLFDAPLWQNNGILMADYGGNDESKR